MAEEDPIKFVAAQDAQAIYGLLRRHRRTETSFRGIVFPALVDSMIMMSNVGFDVFLGDPHQAVNLYAYDR